MPSLRQVAAALAVAVSPVSGLSARDDSTVACQNLTAALGSVKTDSNQLSAQFVQSQDDYWNTRLAKNVPTCVVYPDNAQDISVALGIIKESGSQFAIKSQGHNTNDFFSTVNDGVLIDLSNMTAMSYDESTTLATYEPGSNWGQLYEYYLPYGVTVVGGRIAGVGTGLALGGGMSFISPQYGMACDSFRELEIVLPNGTITTASNTTNPDLFFGLKGGGGNAYGVVTKYTVQARAIGTFYAGNIVYVLDEHELVLNATRDFILYNTDPKAAILHNYNILGSPDLQLGLDEAAVMFLIYDGEDPGDAFVNFTSIPYLLNTLGPKPYTEVANLPIPDVAKLSAGYNFFRIGVHYADDDSYMTAWDAFRQWTIDNKGAYEFVHLDYNPVAKSLTDASAAQGGNAMEMPDGPWFWAEYTLEQPSLVTDAQYNATLASFKALVDGTPNAARLPYFLNEAATDQDALKTFSSYSRLQQIKAKYDPDGFFSSKTGGWSFS